MYRVNVIFTDEVVEDEEEFETYDQAYSHGEYLVSCYHTGSLELNMRDPDENPYDPDEEVDFEVIDLDDEE